MPTLGKKLHDDLTEQWFMDSLVKQLQQVIPLKFQTMEIKFAPLQTVHLSRTFKLLPTLGGSSAVILLSFGVMIGVGKIMKKPITKHEYELFKEGYRD